MPPFAGDAQQLEPLGVSWLRKSSNSKLVKTLAYSSASACSSRARATSLLRAECAFNAGLFAKSAKVIFCFVISVLR